MPFTEHIYTQNHNIISRAQNRRKKRKQNPNKPKKNSIEYIIRFFFKHIFLQENQQLVEYNLQLIDLI
jgi:hypothetical protein